MAEAATRTGVEDLWAPIEGALAFVGECTLILWDVVKRLFRRPFEVLETVHQMAFIGVSSVPIVALTAFFSGAVLSLYGTEFLVRFGAGSLAGATVGLAVTREIGPVLGGIMVAGRCGSAMAAQLGSMAVTEQIDALRMLSVHPTNYLVIPRLIAALLMLPVLGLVGMWAGVFGGMLVAGANGVPGGLFLQSIQQYVQPWDVVGGLLKMPVFGAIIAVVACQQGMRTKEGAVGVGRATTNTVVIAMVLIYVANYLLAELLF
ncbi:MAG: ABC transporter permease [Fimbriimonadaceae bacterium]|nr:ABC transporter permease [Fimbriimonadaceae bacterium]